MAQTKYNPEIAQAIVKAVGEGVPLRYACDVAGAKFQTVREWIARGEGKDERKPNKLFEHFAAEIRKAQALDVRRRIKRLAKAAQGGQVTFTRTVKKANGQTITEVKRAEPRWGADMAILERVYGAEFGKKERVEHTGKDGKELPPIRFVVVEKATREPKVVEQAPELPALPPSLTIADEGGAA